VGVLEVVNGFNALTEQDRLKHASNAAFLLRILRLRVDGLANDTILYNSYRKSIYTLEATMCEYLT
jgi:hypothetical protein